MLDLHLAYHVAEALVIIYLAISQHYTRQMMVHLARTITSVNDHLDVLVALSKKELKYEQKAMQEDFSTNENQK